ncbi:MAG: hypothetical protein ACREFS_06810, partial [Acetobacteraceae bacterium]
EPPATPPCSADFSQSNLGIPTAYTSPIGRIGEVRLITALTCRRKPMLLLEIDGFIDTIDALRAVSKGQQTSGAGHQARSL